MESVIKSLVRTARAQTQIGALRGSLLEVTDLFTAAMANIGRFSKLGSDMTEGLQKNNLIDFLRIKKNLEKVLIFFAEIDGEDINQLDEYLEAVWRVFEFPEEVHMSYNAYLDWICDLSWLDSNGYVFAILNADSLIAQCPKDRKMILRSLEGIVIPWWEGEVERHVVEGKAKPFNVYLVD